MPSTYSESFYHFVWSTYRREEQITSAIQEPLYNYIASKSRELGVVVIAIGGMPDHMHVACVLPPRLSPADYMHRIKGSSSYYINHGPFKNAAVAWQPGYGILTYSCEQVQVVVRYIRNQQEHHENGTVRPKLERTTEPLQPDSAYKEALDKALETRS